MMQLADAARFLGNCGNVHVRLGPNEIIHGDRYGAWMTGNWGGRSPLGSWRFWNSCHRGLLITKLVSETLWQELSRMTGMGGRNCHWVPSKISREMPIGSTHIGTWPKAGISIQRVCA